MSIVKGVIWVAAILALAWVMTCASFRVQAEWNPPLIHDIVKKKSGDRV